MMLPHVEPLARGLRALGLASLAFIGACDALAPGVNPNGIWTAQLAGTGANPFYDHMSVALAHRGDQLQGFAIVYDSLDRPVLWPGVGGYIQSGALMLGVWPSDSLRPFEFVVNELIRSPQGGDTVPFRLTRSGRNGATDGTYALFLGDRPAQALALAFDTVVVFGDGRARRHIKSAGSLGGEVDVIGLWSPASGAIVLEPAANIGFFVPLFDTLSVSGATLRRRSPLTASDTLVETYLRVGAAR
jgi:hypothetical protein